MLSQQRSKSPTGKLTRLYIFSLSTIALLAIAGQLLVRQMLNQQSDNLQVIVLAENVRFLSEQLAKESLSIQILGNLADQQGQSSRFQRFQKTLGDCEKSYYKFKNEQSLKAALPGKNAEFKQLYSLLEVNYSSMISAAQMYEKVNLLDQPRQNPTDRTLVRKILATEQIFVRDIDRLVAIYSQEAKLQIGQLKWVEAILLGFTLVVLLLEGILVFRPAIAKLKLMFAELAAEQEKSEQLLLNVLPKSIVAQLKQGKTGLDQKSDAALIAEGFAEATILFADIAGFTTLSANIPPQEVVHLLNKIFSAFDQLTEKYQLEKIKTIGDAYMVVGGLPIPRKDHAEAIANMAMEMQTVITQFKSHDNQPIQVRIGINTGPVVAGVIGLRKFIYDLWGDTVNIASRMESQGLVGEIQVTEATYDRLKEHYVFEERGVLSVKGRGEMTTYLLKSKAGISHSVKPET